MQARRPRNDAFSLVELAIVLVILGLLTGGVLTGQSLIRAAELRAVTEEYSRYVTATQTFRDKYLALPGDMSTATRFWSRTVNAAHCVTNSTAAVAAPGTCDGDGDGRIEDGVTGNESQEIFQFFRQLALAGLIEGTYTGIAGAANGTVSTININVPSSKADNVGWSIWYTGPYVGSATVYARNYDHVVSIGTQSTTTTTQGKFLKPEEAWNIDTKMDDGKPAYGDVVARFWNNECAAADDGTHANTDLVASYKLQDTTEQCALYFNTRF